MKSRWITLALCVLAAVILIARLVPHGQREPARAAKGHTANPLAGLRDLALHGTRDNFGLGSGVSPNQPFVVVADWGDAQGATTMVAVADGSASVYRSDGGGSMGGGQAHPEIHAAALKAIEVATAVQPSMQRTSEYPPAGPGKVSFYLVTDAGVFTATAAQDELAANRSTYSALAAAMRDIEAEYKKAERR
jgi:hypothetical protein